MMVRIPKAGMPPHTWGRVAETSFHRRLRGGLYITFALTFGVLSRAVMSGRYTLSWTHLIGFGLFAVVGLPVIDTLVRPGKMGVWIVGLLLIPVAVFAPTILFVVIPITLLFIAGVRTIADRS
ncbi:MAG: hypothetical protein ACI9QL_000529 [Candidatus Omnitrophota bacterium]|jgi:hypothetical protein